MNIFMIAITIIALLVVVAISLTGYVKAAPDEAIIISGLKKRKRFLIGRAGIKFLRWENSQYRHIKKDNDGRIV